ncbi:MAG: YkgJ family cysteine cluster protein [Candidatus Electryonea clarkiae]|nr:YkgJ family cysteine cluster protein [Candidatus Electryonea clarkiae]MDP8288986.1 YkgJ family cysteine cluster protein [Candidatus Electryonea clarkiae]
MGKLTAEDLKDQFTAFDHFKKKLFDEAERLPANAEFSFSCNPGVSCFNKCCTDVNIFLTPYDIIRLKNRFDMDSEEFLARYTIMPMDARQSYPIVLFKMQNDEDKSCPFLDAEKGCSVYEDRPWPCRMFPIGKASPKEESAFPFYFFMREDVCKGFEEATDNWTIESWIENQEVGPYDEMGELFKGIALNTFFGKGQRLTPPLMEMFHMVCYNIDKFKVFVFESTFLDRFEVPEDRIEKMRTDDVELQKFGYEWLRFSLFQERTMVVKEEAK